MIIKNQKGVAAVEFAIILPLLILILFGIIEFSLMLYNKAMLTNASREGARVGIVWAYDVTDPDNPTYHPTDREIIDTVKNYCRNYLITFGADTLEDPDIAIKWGNPPDPLIDNEVGRISSENAGASLSVTVTYHYDFLVIPNLITNLIGGIDLDGISVMRLE